MGEKPDVILHAGDWASTKHCELEGCLKLFREYFPSTPIVSVFGNHDLWQEECCFTTIDQQLTANEALFEKYDIANEYADLQKKVHVVAFQSWYRTVRPPSNDTLWSPEPERLHYIMKDKMVQSFEETQQKLLKHRGFTKVIVSHFSPYHYRYGYTQMCGPVALFETLMAQGLRYLCLGHSHEYQNEDVDGCTILNCGSDYDEPKYVTFEI